MAGYKAPEIYGYVLRKKYQDHINKLLVEHEVLSQMQAKEVVERLTHLARSDKSTDQNKLRALELLAKIHGLTSEKLAVTIDRKELLEDVKKQLATLSNVVPPNSLDIPLQPVGQKPS